MATLSVILITKNEASRIRQCLESVKFAEEIIVLDSGSTDETVTICREYTPYVFSKDWPGFGAQKNRALAKATQDWVLSLDADEVVTPELQAEILNSINSSQNNTAYAIPRLSKYCGRYIRYGDWRNDYVVRLFRNGTAKFKEVPVHESLIVKGQPGKLSNILLHDSFPNLETVLQKVNEYSTAGAKLKAEQGKKSSLTKALVHALWCFIRGYIFRLGFLDGREGFMLAVSNAEGVYYRYVKLIYLNKKP